MNRYVFFAAKETYYKVAFQDILDRSDVVYQPDFLPAPTKIQRILHTLHNFRGIAKYVDLPFKKVWYPLYFSEKDHPQDRYIFIFLWRWYRICSCGFLSFLREKYPGCKCVLYLTDIQNAKKIDMDKMKTLFDHIMLFERIYAEKCDVEYFPLVYSEGLKEIPMGERDIDLLFVGGAKGRYPFLKKIYDRLNRQGIRCVFYLSNIDQEVEPRETGIHIVDKVPYEDTIRLLKRSKCVLDIIPPNTNCNTLRMSEAMYYNTRVLTNNLYIVHEEYYDPDLISIYSDPDMIDVDFLRKPYGNVDYPYREKISPNAFLKHIDDIFAS